MQEGSILDIGKVKDKNMDVSDPKVLVDSGKTQIYNYVDGASLTEPQSLKHTYEQRAGLGSDNTSHRGLGFSEELGRIRSVPKTSQNCVPEEESSLSSLSFEEVETDFTYGDELSEGDDLLARIPSTEKNSGFLSLGGLKLYTEDISCSESVEDDDEVSNGESIESFESVESSGSSENDGMSDADSSIDEEVAEDYFVGIQGSERFVNADLLVGKFCHVTDDGISGGPGGNDSDTLRKFGGNHFQDVSKECSLKKPQLGRKCSAKPGTSCTNAWSSALDDLMAIKVCKTVSKKKKHGSRFPLSWPSEAGKSKNFRRSPGNYIMFHRVLKCDLFT